MSDLKFIGFCFQEINFAYIVFCFLFFFFGFFLFFFLFWRIYFWKFTVIKRQILWNLVLQMRPVEVLRSYFQWRIIGNFNNSVFTLNLTVEIIQSFQEILPNFSLRREILQHFEEFNLVNCHKQQYFPKLIFANWG